MALIDDPVNFFGGFLKHGYHRAVSMIGRLISGKAYIPFYMKRSQIYDEPRKQDGKHRVKPLIQNVKGISDISIPAGEFTICQSGILALMGIRQNDDIDIIISSEARNQLFGGNTNFMRERGAEIFEPNRGKFRIFDAQGDDDLIENYSFKQIHISDINLELVLCYRQLQSSVDDVISSLEKLVDEFPSTTEERSDYFYKIRDLWNSNLDIESMTDEERSSRVAQMIFLNKTCFNGLFRLNRSGKFNVPTGRYKNPSFPSAESLREVKQINSKVEA